MKLIHRLRLILSVRNLLPFVYVFLVYLAVSILGLTAHFDWVYILSTPLGAISWYLFRDTLLFFAVWCVIVLYGYLFYEIVRGFLK